MVYEEASEVLEKLSKLKISAPQIQGVCGYYAGAMDAFVQANCQAVIPTLEKARNTDQTTSVMVDGSMIYTREDPWREMKLGRSFHKSHLLDIPPNRCELTQSMYVSHWGSADGFFAKFERFLTSYRKKVILADGASWIWQWAEDNYPGATPILDFSHAQENLTVFARHQYRDEAQRTSWLHAQKLQLLASQVESVIAALPSIRLRSKEAKEAREKAINYSIEYDDRMQYKTYLAPGLLIGSGPIEAAHGSVIQQRMKLSGQNWSVIGAKAVANLRCYKQSQAWHAVQCVIAAAA